MADMYKKKSDFDIARQQESKAHNELAYCESQADNQKKQLSETLTYRDECEEALGDAIQMGLTPLHIRELQLLVEHIDTVVETMSYKVDISQDQVSQAKDNWRQQNNILKQVKTSTERKKASSNTAAKEVDEATPKDWKEKVSNTPYLGKRLR